MKSKLTFIIIVFHTFYFTAQLLPDYVATDELEAWWSFENNANDLSQNNHNGVVYDVDYMNDFHGLPESSAFFSGTASSYIELDHSNQLNFSGSDNYTIAMWIKPLNNPNNGAHSGILTKWNENQNTNSYPYRIATTDLGNGTSEVVWVNYHSQTTTQNILLTVVENDRYVHLAYVIENNTVSLYKNGYFESSLAFNDLNYSNTDDIFIGKRNVGANRRYHGYIDEMGIWSRALNECEVRSLVTFNDEYLIDYEIVNNSNGELEVINSSLTPDNYQWFECINGNQTPISGANSSTYSPQSPGEFSVELTFNGLDCSHNSGCFDSQTLNLENVNTQLNNISSVILYPNPSSEYLNVDLLIEKEIGEMDYQIIDITGKIIQVGLIQKGVNYIDVLELSKGSYFFQVPQLSKSIKFISN